MPSICRKYAAITGLVWLAALGVGCTALRPWGTGHGHPSHGGTPGYSYPALFCQGGMGVIGVGFSVASPYSRDEACSRAVTMACRSLAWAQQVRVQGERLVERMPSGHRVFCGESIRLLEVPEIMPQTCVLDTEWIGEQVWVVAAPPPGPPPVLGPSLPLPSTAPDWIAHPPQEPGVRYAVGAAPTAHTDEPSAWELAEYQALLDLGFAVSSTVINLGKPMDRSLVGVETIKVNALLHGFRVAARWRDATHVHVLARVPLPEAPGE